MRKMIIGPWLEDIERADFSGPEATLATAFYTAWPFDEFQISARKIHLYVRLSTDDLSDWVNGCVDPPALLRFIERHEAKGIAVNLRRSKDAHAKLYMGRAALLVGSANFTGKGLSARGHEVLWREDNARARAAARKSIAEYGTKLSPMTSADLAAFVAANQSRVKELKRRRKSSPRDESRANPFLGRPERLGTYEDFDAWVGLQRPGSSAETLYAHAFYRDGNSLGAHAKTCFYGVRQLLLAHPSFRRHLLKQPLNGYRALADPVAIDLVRAFSAVAVDEPGFKASSWRNPLPKELGGIAAKRGGNIGSLNPTLPLLARYLDERLNS